MADTGSKDLAAVRLMVDRVALKQGWVPNPDASFRETIETGLMKTWNRHGYFLCPCRDGDGTRELDRDIICPCIYAKPDIAEHGHCFCGLYLSPDLARSGKAVEAIPERRESF